MSMFIYKGGGGVKNGQNLVYVIKVWPLREIVLPSGPKIPAASEIATPSVWKDKYKIYYY